MRRIGLSQQVVVIEYSELVVGFCLESLLNVIH